MLLNVDRRRIYIFSAIGVFFLLMLGLYHAPAYVPKEVSRMKTSVSTWLKGTEPSLNDELYKDSPHFSSSNRPSSQEQDAPQPDPFEIKETSPTTDDEMLHALPIPGEIPQHTPVVTDDKPDILPPGAAHSAPAVSHAPLPGVDDIVNVLPPNNAFSLLGAQSLEHATATATTASTSHHRHLEEVTMPTDFEATTFVTHVVEVPAPTAPAHVALPSDIREALQEEEEKWMIDHGEDGAY